MARSYKPRPKSQSFKPGEQQSFKPTNKRKKTKRHLIIPTKSRIPASEIKDPETKGFPNPVFKSGRFSKSIAHCYEHFLQGGYTVKELNANSELASMLEKAKKRHAKMKEDKIINLEFLRLNHVLSDLKLINPRRKKR